MVVRLQTTYTGLHPSTVHCRSLAAPFSLPSPPSEISLCINHHIENTAWCQFPPHDRLVRALVQGCSIADGPWGEWVGGWDRWRRRRRRRRPKCNKRHLNHREMRPYFTKIILSHALAIELCPSRAGEATQNTVLILEINTPCLVVINSFLADLDRQLAKTCSDWL